MEVLLSASRRKEQVEGRGWELRKRACWQEHGLEGGRCSQRQHGSEEEGGQMPQINLQGGFWGQIPAGRLSGPWGETGTASAQSLSWKERIIGRYLSRLLAVMLLTLGCAW